MDEATTTAADAVTSHLHLSTRLSEEWAGIGVRMPNRHNLRVDRLRTSWPSLTKLLDALVESLPSVDEEATFTNASGVNVACPTCGVRVASMSASPDPRSAEQVHRAQPCGHVLTRDDAIAAWEAGVQHSKIVPVDGPALIRAEARRNREQGRSIEGDLALGEDDLAWAAWCYIDRRDSPGDTTTPGMWPEGMEWKQPATRIRALIAAGALIAAEIDRSLAGPPKPQAVAARDGSDPVRA